MTAAGESLAEDGFLLIGQTPTNLPDVGLLQVLVIKCIEEGSSGVIAAVKEIVVGNLEVGSGARGI